MYVYPTRPVLLHSAFTLASSTPLLSFLALHLFPLLCSTSYSLLSLSLSVSFVRSFYHARLPLSRRLRLEKEEIFQLLPSSRSSPSPLHSFCTPSRQDSPLCLPVFRFLSIAFYPLPFLAICLLLCPRANALACPSHGRLIYLFLSSSFIVWFATVSSTNGGASVSIYIYIYIYIYGSVASDRNGSSSLSLSRVGSTFSIDSRFGPGSIWLSRIPGFEVEFELKSLFLLKIKVDRVWNKSWGGNVSGVCIARVNHERGCIIPINLKNRIFRRK